MVERKKLIIPNNFGSLSPEEKEAILNRQNDTQKRKLPVDGRQNFENEDIRETFAREFGENGLEPDDYSDRIINGFVKRIDAWQKARADKASAERAKYEDFNNPPGDTTPRAQTLNNGNKVWGADWTWSKAKHQWVGIEEYAHESSSERDSEGL